MLRVDLGNLTKETGAALLHHADAKRAGVAEIKADDTELLDASREVDGHALTLNLPGRFLARAHGGDIRRRDLVKFEEADRQEQGGTTFKMLAAFETWFARGGEFGARQLSALRLMGLFDGPADSGCLAGLRSAPAIAGLTESLFIRQIDASTGEASFFPLAQEDWNLTTSFLSDFGLLTIQTANDNRHRLLDCHPLIREYFAKKLKSIRPTAWKEAHNRLYHQYRDRAKQYPQTVEEMGPLYAAVRHACRSDQHDEAMVKIFRGRILRDVENYSWKQLGLFGSDLAALVDFFKTAWREPIDTINEFDRDFVLAIVGFHLKALGRLTEALQPTQLSLEAFSKKEEWRACSVVSKNLSELYLIIGNIDVAIRYAHDSVEFAAKGGDQLQWRDSQSCVANALHHAGRLDERGSVCPPTAGPSPSRCASGDENPWAASQTVEGGFQAAP